MHLPTKRVVDILTLLVEEGGGKRLCEISKILSIPKGTLSPILDTLLEARLINKRGDYYYGGTELFALGCAVAENIPYKEMIRAELRALRDIIGETCYLGILDGGDVLYLEKADSPNPLRMLTGVGHKLPAYATGVGKALIMDKAYEELATLYGGELKRLTKNTVADLDSLYRQLCTFRAQGYTEEIEESTEYIRCFGTPIKKGGRTVGAISVAIPTFRFDEIDTPSCIKELKRTSERIGAIWMD